jgi:simple sugar transport system ATP-binding protein
MVRRGLIDRKAVSAYARKIIDNFNVKCIGPASPARSLSGGNLQKFIVGREIGLDPRVLIVAQPTWGVDVAAAAFIRQTLIDLSRAGAAVLVISEELEELFEICDRIAVIYQGRLSPALPRAQTNVEEIGLLMAGVGPAFQTEA